MLVVGWEVCLRQPWQSYLRSEWTGPSPGPQEKGVLVIRVGSQELQVELVDHLGDWVEVDYDLHCFANYLIVAMIGLEAFVWQEGLEHFSIDLWQKFQIQVALSNY